MLSDVSIEYRNAWIGRHELRVIHYSQNIADLRIQPSSRLGKLSGNLNDYYSTRTPLTQIFAVRMDKEGLLTSYVTTQVTAMLKTGDRGDMAYLYCAPGRILLQVRTNAQL